MASFKCKGIYLGNSSTISGQNEKINTKFTIKDYFDVSGELSNQIGISNKVMSEFGVSHLGIYSACASFTEGLIVSASVLGSTQLKRALTVVSSHNLNAERTFRFPIEYGAPRRITQNFTATGAVASLITKDPMT